jgi:hypothetical protein
MQILRSISLIDFGRHTAPPRAIGGDSFRRTPSRPQTVQYPAGHGMGNFYAGKIWRRKVSFEQIRVTPEIINNF